MTQSSVTIGVRLANVVDSDPKSEERGRRVPGPIATAVVGKELVIDLIDNIYAAVDNIGIKGCSTVCEVVGQEMRFIVFGCQVLNPVLAIGAGRSRVGWIAERVRRGRLSVGENEPSSGVRIAT